MKEIKAKVKTNFLKKIFIKICRILGYEIIDQSNFYVPTRSKYLNKNLNIPGNKSITLPLGETKITRKIKSLTIIFRSCTSVNMLTQNKKRMFDQPKSEYTFRSLNSIISSLNIAKINFPQVKFDIIIIDHASKKNDIEQMKKQLNNSNFENLFISLNINDFKSKIKKINQENKEVSDNQISNMSNIHKSLLLAKERCEDLIYFVEDDYIHQRETFTEMLSSYERIASQLNKELILCPADYPFLYTNTDYTNIFLGYSKHWRLIDQTLCTFLTSKKILESYWNNLTSMCEFEHYPFEKPLHEIYKSEYCLSPIPSLALHCTNINSAYGLSPIMDWKKVWDENEKY
tara:strand:+ start:194 stop:1228 length:1035 start_codon:yes stop_codon:yes gene_type:complete